MVWLVCESVSHKGFFWRYLMYPKKTLWLIAHLKRYFNEWKNESSQMDEWMNGCMDQWILDQMDRTRTNEVIWETNNQSVTKGSSWDASATKKERYVYKRNIFQNRKICFKNERCVKKRKMFQNEINVSKKKKMCLKRERYVSKKKLCFSETCFKKRDIFKGERYA